MKAQIYDPHHSSKPIAKLNTNPSDEEVEDFKYTINHHIGNAIEKHGRNMWVKGVDLGWDKRVGEQWINLTNPQDIWKKVIPDTDFFSFSLYKTGEKTYKAVCSHHDVPTGEKYYYKFIKGEKE